VEMRLNQNIFFWTRSLFRGVWKLFFFKKENYISYNTLSFWSYKCVAIVTLWLNCQGRIAFRKIMVLFYCNILRGKSWHSNSIKYTTIERYVSFKYFQSSQLNLKKIAFSSQKCICFYMAFRSIAYTHIQV